MSSIFLNDSVNELLSGGSAAQQANAALELRHERHGVPDEVPSLDRSVPHLPTCKFPAKSQEEKKTTKHKQLTPKLHSKAVLITIMLQPKH